MSAFSGVKRFGTSIFGSGSSTPRSLSRSASSTRYGLSTTAAAAKSVTHKSSAEKRANRSKLLNAQARERRHQTKSERNAQSSVPDPRVNKHLNTGEPFHMPLSGFNKNMNKLKMIPKTHRNPKKIIEYKQTRALSVRRAKGVTATKNTNRSRSKRSTSRSKRSASRSKRGATRKPRNIGKIF